MKKIIYLVIIVIIVFTINSMAQKSKLEVGDKIPSFTLLDQYGKAFSMENWLGKKAIVLYFYPKDDTPGCTKEACKFRDEYEDFTDLDAIVIGISSDNVASHKNFSDKYQIPFTLLADTEKTVRKLFGVPKSMGFLPGRVTYVINKKGEIIYLFNSMTKAELHVEKSIQFIKESNKK